MLRMVPPPRSGEGWESYSVSVEAAGEGAAS
jgi:hypothetical protein